MQSIKLTDQRRNEIASALLAGKFDKRRDALIEAAASLAEAVYKHAYKKHIDAMAAVPEGWLSNIDGIDIKFFDAKDDYVHLAFNGCWGDKYLLGVAKRKLEVVCHRIPYEGDYPVLDYCALVLIFLIAFGGCTFAQGVRSDHLGKWCIRDFTESIHGCLVAPALSRLVPFGEGASIGNNDPENQSVPERRIWIGAKIQIGPKSVVRNVFNILLGRKDRRLQKGVVPHDLEWRIKTPSLVSASDLYSLDDGSEFSTVRDAVSEGGVREHLLLKAAAVSRVCHGRSGPRDAPYEDIGSLQEGNGFCRDLSSIGGLTSYEPQADSGEGKNAAENGSPSLGRGPRDFIWFLVGCAIGGIVLLIGLRR